MICGMGVLMWTAGSIGSQTQIARLCDTVFCMAGTLLIVALRFKDRMSHDRQQKEEDPYWQPKESFLERPGFGALWYFGITYNCRISAKGDYEMYREKRCGFNDYLYFDFILDGI